MISINFPGFSACRSLVNSFDNTHNLALFLINCAKYKLTEGSTTVQNTQKNQKTKTHEILRNSGVKQNPNNYCFLNINVMKSLAHQLAKSDDFEINNCLLTSKDLSYSLLIFTLASRQLQQFKISKSHTKTNHKA